MSLEEAFTEMRKGNKVRHMYFTSDEYFHMVNGKVVCEGGYDMTAWFRNTHIDTWKNNHWSVV